MQALADFCSSPQGRLYAQVCERYGVDPGAVFDDDVAAFNLRLGLIVTAPEVEETSPGITTDLAQQMKAMAHG